MSEIVRISITLPQEVLAAADREAKRLDRSRSWVVAEAVRRYVAGPRQVGEPATVPYGAAGLGPYRAAQLAADLALTPEQRVREAERTRREAELARGAAPQGSQVRVFERYEDYLSWQQYEGAGR